MTSVKLTCFFLFSVIFAFRIFAYPAYKGSKHHEKNKTNSIYLGGKHIVILSSDNKNVFGTYYLGVFNEEKFSQKLKISILLPDKTVDFEPQEGVNKEDFILDGDGTLFVQKEFKPGLSLIGVNFKVPYGYGEREPLKFKMPYDLDELSVATPVHSQLTVKSPGFKEGVPAMLSSGNYSGILRHDLKKGFVFKVDLEGLPNSLYFSWSAAGITGCLLLFFLVLYLYNYTVNNRRRLN